MALECSVWEPLRWRQVAEPTRMSLPFAIDICSKLMFMGYSQEPFGVQACQQCISLS